MGKVIATAQVASNEFNSWNEFFTTECCLKMTEQLQGKPIELNFDNVTIIGFVKKAWVKVQVMVEAEIDGEKIPALVKDGILSPSFLVPGGEVLKRRIVHVNENQIVRIIDEFRPHMLGLTSKPVDKTLQPLIITTKVADEQEKG